MITRLVAILGLLIAAPAWAQTADEARQAIETANEQFMQAFNQGDAAAVANLYAEGATILPPGAQRMSGRKAIQQFWQGAIEGGIKGLKLTTVEVQPLGADHAFEIGEFSLRAPGEGGATAPVAGNYLVVWERVADGRWQLQADIWNMSAADGEVAQE